VIQLAREYRRVVTYDELPLVVRQAILAAEDKNFHSHSGVDYGALPRVIQKAATQSLAAWKNGSGLRLRLPQGGSTLTQQLVRVYFLGYLTARRDDDAVFVNGLTVPRVLSAILGAPATNSLPGPGLPDPVAPLHQHGAGRVRGEPARARGRLSRHGLRGAGGAARGREGHRQQRHPSLPSTGSHRGDRPREPGPDSGGAPRRDSPPRRHRPRSQRKSVSDSGDGQDRYDGEFRDALFVGSTYGPQGITVAVRIGFDDNRTLGDKETGRRTALPIFREIMVRVCEAALAGVVPGFPRDMEGPTRRVPRNAGGAHTSPASRSAPDRRASEAGPPPRRRGPDWNRDGDLRSRQPRRGARGIDGRRRRRVGRCSRSGGVRRQPMSVSSRTDHIQVEAVATVAAR